MSQTDKADRRSLAESGNTISDDMLAKIVESRLAASAVVATLSRPENASIDAKDELLTDACQIQGKKTSRVIPPASIWFSTAIVLAMW
jgi:hypothetical protein